jgi:hypothetical protein
VYVSAVPRISAFYGILTLWTSTTIRHLTFHARYGHYEVQLAIADGEFINGGPPQRARSLVREWVELHRHSLRPIGSWLRTGDHWTRLTHCHECSV